MQITAPIGYRQADLSDLAVGKIVLRRDHGKWRPVRITAIDDSGKVCKARFVAMQHTRKAKHQDPQGQQPINEFWVKARPMH